MLKVRRPRDLELETAGLPLSPRPLLDTTTLVPRGLSGREVGPGSSVRVLKLLFSPLSSSRSSTSAIHDREEARVRRRPWSAARCVPRGLGGKRP